MKLEALKRGSTHWLLAAAVLVVLAVPAAAATVRSASQEARKPGGTSPALRALAKVTRGLERRVAGLEARSRALQGAQPPTSLPPTGPAGGALMGSYPKPRLRPDSVGLAELADGGIRSADVADNTLERREISPGAVGEGTLGREAVRAEHIGTVILGAEKLLPAASFPPRTLNSGALTLKPGAPGRVTTATCPLGLRLLGGGWSWSNTNGRGTVIVDSHPARPELGHDPNRTWEIRARVKSLGDENTILPEAFCVVG